MFKKIKSLRKIPNSWKVACVNPILTKGDRKVVDNYRPVSLLNIVSKVLEICIYSSLFKHFVIILCKQQHGLVKQKSVWTNKFKLLQQIYEAIEKNSKTDIVAVYSDFAKAFGKVPHFELLRKMPTLASLFDYLKERKQFVRVNNVCSEVLEVTSGLPQGCLLGPLLFCIFINDLPVVLFFAEPFFFADDLKLLSLRNIFWNFQDDLCAVEKWVMRNKMDPAREMCSQKTFQSVSNQMKLLGWKLDSTQVIKDLGVTVQKNLGHFIVETC